MSQLEDLLQQCTVKLILPSGGWGTGFFVAPGLILTCAHVVREATDETIQVRWQKQENWAEAVMEKALPDPYDVALLRVTLPPEAHPTCVYLDGEVRSRDPLYLFGYPDQDFPNGCPVTVNCEGLTGDEPALIKFALGQVRPGMSGAPLLNQRTGKVCGMVKFTRDRSFDLGGGAILTDVILAQFPELRELQQEFHRDDRRWIEAMEVMLIDSERENQKASIGEGDPHVSQVHTGNGDNIAEDKVGGDKVVGTKIVHNYFPSNESPSDQPVNKILMLPANPSNIERSFRKEEIKKIREAMNRSKYGELIDKPDIDAEDISQELEEIKPYIVHISGHENGIEGLILENNLEVEKLTELEKSQRIADLFKLHSQNVYCILLNGCYSENQAKEIVHHIDFVIGISHFLDRNQTLKFLNEFYFFLGKRTIQAAYEAALNRLDRTNLKDDQLTPVLLEKRRIELEERLKTSHAKIEEGQGNASLWQEQAYLLEELGQPEEAYEAYEEASILDPNSYQIRVKQGDALEKIGQLERALSAYEKALKLEKKDYKVWWKKSQTLIKVGKYEEAIVSYEKAFALASPTIPQRYMIAREYASLLDKLAQYQKSIDLYKKSLSIEPRYRAASYDKKRLYKKIYSRKD